MRSSYDSSISSDSIDVGGVAAIVLLMCRVITSIKYEMWVFSPVGLDEC